MREITERQAQILVYIEKYIAQNGYSLTMREIGEHFKMTAKAAHDHVFALEKKGRITSERRKTRTIKITSKKRGGEA